MEAVTTWVSCQQGDVHKTVLCESDSRGNGNIFDYLSMMTMTLMYTKPANGKGYSGQNSKPHSEHTYIFERLDYIIQDVGKCVRFSRECRHSINSATEVKNAHQHLTVATDASHQKQNMVHGPKLLKSFREISLIL